ncbi:MAG: long-chain-fatty-acid--CoA ligase, partial [Proteobacteria bacterium]
MTENQTQPWLKNYPASMQKTINPDRFSSLAEMIDETCQKFGPQTAFSNMGFEMTFSEIDEASKKMAAFFQSELKLKKGDRIVMMMPNLLQYPIALFGAIRAGLVIINTNPLYTATEMQKCFADSGATTIVILENFADKLEQILSQTQIKNIIVTEIGDVFPTFKRVLTNTVVRYVK